MKLIKCEKVLEFSDSINENLIYSLQELIERGILVDHINKKPLIFNDKNELVNSAKQKLKLMEGSPITIPYDIQKDYGNMCLNDIIKISDPIIQYQVLSYIKGSGEVIGVNADKNLISYKKHLYRMKSFLSNMTGDVLDVGCDDISSSLNVIPKSCKYLGLDSFVSSSEYFKVFGLAEMLPFANNSFNNLLFNASLDHVLDYNEAILEAWRVLKNNGYLYISSYVWKERATLLKDIIHFHHFRRDQLLCSLTNYFNIIEVQNFECPKNNNHRYQIFVKAKKIGKN